MQVTSLSVFAMNPHFGNETLQSRGHRIEGKMQRFKWESAGALGPKLICVRDHALQSLTGGAIG
jgi:hypothetical protein